MPTFSKLNVLITRPEQKAQALVDVLRQQKIACVKQVLFDYAPSSDRQESKELLTNSGIIIFVSVAAVEFAQTSFSAKGWRYHHIIAVGQSTKIALHNLGIKHVLCPAQENSEGLLSLPELSNNHNLNNERVTIVRGNGGREHLANQLISNGAQVHYLESYKRVWRTFSKDIAERWFEQQINCIVVTSNAILEKLIQLTSAQHNSLTSSIFWRDHCVWLVASQRISNKAKQFGLAHVINTNGASEQAISACLQQLSLDN